MSSHSCTFQFQHQQLGQHSHCTKDMVVVVDNNMLSRAGLLPSDVGAPSLKGALQAAADAGEGGAGDSCAAADATPRDNKAARCVQLQQLAGRSFPSMSCLLAR
jgi:hypothetical protein